MSAEKPGNYYIRLDIGEELDVFDIESFISYRIKLVAGGQLPHLVIEFNASGILADNLKKELREETVIILHEGLNRDESNVSEWTVTSPAFSNSTNLTTFRVECLLKVAGYDSENLTGSISGTSVDVMEEICSKYLNKDLDVIADPQDSMTWAMGLSVPQEALTKTQVRYWGSESPNTALTFGIDEVGPVIIRDLKMALDEGPKFELYYDLLPTNGISTIAIMADYTIQPHNGLQSRVGGVTRKTGITTVDEDGSIFADLVGVDGIESPFAGSIIESEPTYDSSLPGRIDWIGLQDNQNVHENWTLARNTNIAQITRAMDVSISVIAPENLRDVKLLDVVLFKEQTYDKQLLDTFSGLYFITELERVFDPKNRSVSTILTINKDGA